MRPLRSLLLAFIVFFAPAPALAVTAPEPDLTAATPAGEVSATAAAVDSAEAAAEIEALPPAAPAPPTSGLVAAGSSSSGQLGLGTRGHEDYFWQVGRDESWMQVAAGDDSACGIRAGGTLWCWGYGADGRLGTGGTSTVTEPVQIGSAAGWTDVTVADGHACAIGEGDALWCWGSGSYGKLGTGSTTSAKVPVRVGTGRWSDVSAAQDSTCGVQTDGSLWCWGYGASGQLGTGKTTSVAAPERVGAAGVRWSAVSAGAYHTCAIDSAGGLACWGDNNLGEAGDGTLGRRTTPQPIEGRWRQVSAGFDSTCGVQTDGTLWCWGYGGSGQLGLGDLTSRRAPQRVGSASDWNEVASTRYATCATKADATLWCWGSGATGQLGLGDLAMRREPEQVTTPSIAHGIAEGSTARSTLVLTSDTTPVNACQDGATAKYFAALGDQADYVLAPGGDFETTLAGWALDGAGVVAGNETVGIVGGARSLLLGGKRAATATSPPICVNDAHPHFRFLAKATSGSGVLTTAIRFRPRDKPSYELMLASRVNVAARDWVAVEPNPLATRIVASLLKRGGTVELIFRTPAGTEVQIDNVLVDPYRRG